jgi:hypothetical protein
MEETQRLVAQRRGCKRPDQFTPSRTIDMLFELYPGTLRKIMSLDGSKVRRIISFETSLETPFQRSIFDYSNLKDGRSLSSLPCTTNIRPSDSEELSGTLTYVPKFSADDLNIHEPASLEIEVHLPLQAFDDLWNASHEGKEFLVGGQIEGIPNELEWSIVDALTFNEVFEFGENLKGDLGSLSDAWAYAKSEGHVLRMQWERLKVRLLWLLIRLGTIAGAVWLVWQYANTSQHSTWDTISLLGGAALLLLWLFAAGSGGGSARINARMRRAELLSAMRDAYALTRPTSTMSPIQIRAALLRAQDKGAIWDSSAFALLDRAAMRQPPVWIPF